MSSKREPGGAASRRGGPCGRPGSAADRSRFGVPVLPALLALLGVLGGCASPSWQTALADADALPLHARAELTLIAGGDAALAATLAEEALASAPPDSPAAARALFTLLVASDSLGAVERPLPHLIRVLDATRDPAVAARLVSEAPRAWARLDGQAATSPELARVLERLAAAPGDAWELVRSRARHQLIDADRLSADPQGSSVAARAGYILRWRLSVPWGEAPALDFLEPLGPETRPLAASEDTGAGFGLRPVLTTDETFSDGEVTFFDLPARGGVGFAEAALDATPRPRRVIVRLESNRSCAVFIDGRPVVLREQPTEPWMRAVTVDLPAGSHRLTVKLASADGRGFFRVQLSDLEAPASVDAIRVVASPPDAPLMRPEPGDARGAIAALLDLEDRLSRPRWDLAGARERQALLEASFGPHVALDLLAARLALGDVVTPDAERRQQARRRYEAVLARSPQHPLARRGLARIERRESRPEPALALLRGDGAEPRRVMDPRTQLALLDLYRDRGWEVEALEVATALEPLARFSPRVLQELIDTHHAFGRVARATELVEELVARFPGSGGERLFELQADRGEVDPRIPLALYEAEPQRHARLRDAVRALRRRGALPEAEELVERFLARRAHDGWALSERVRIALQAGDEQRTRELIASALEVRPGFAPLEELDHLLVGSPAPFETLEDSSALSDEWRAFRASQAGSSWGAFPIVTLLDRRRIRVSSDGSTLELVHRIRLVQTKQGADALGDVRPPSGARLLVAHTLKADGRRLEPERTEGKADLSFPELAPGDAVETAWVARSRVSPSEGGYLTGVSFASWGAPIYRLDAGVTVAPGLDFSLTRFGGAPEPRFSKGADGSRSLAWRFERLPPIPREPLSVSTRSFFPFVDIHVVRADEPVAERNAVAWRRIARAYAAQLLELGRIGPRVMAVAEAFRRHRRPAVAAFSWVKEEIADAEQLNSFESTAEASVTTRKGNRALVLWSLLRAAGRDVELLLCAPERDGPPEDRSAPTPNANRFFYPIVSAEGGLLLDPARPYTPPGDLPRELGGARCLVPPVPGGREQSQALFRDLPASSSRPDFVSELTLTIDRDGNARGTLIGSAGGAAASPLRQAFVAQDEVRKRILFEQWLATLALGARLVSYEVSDVASGSRPMRWRLEVEIPAYAERDGEALVVRKPLKTLVHSDFAGAVELAQLVSADGRATPLRLLPLSEAVVLRLETPGHALVSPPVEVGQNGLEQRVVASGDGVVITRRVELGPGRVGPDDYDAFRSAIGEVIRAFEATLRFEPR